MTDRQSASSILADDNRGAVDARSEQHEPNVPNGSTRAGRRTLGQRLRLPLARLRRKGAPDRWLARQQRRRRLRVLLVVLGIAMLGAVVWLVLFSSVLSVQRIEVVGLSDQAESLGSEQVRSAADIAVGTPIARLDAGQAINGISSLTWVQDVEVRRAWPDAVVLAVTERTPVAVVESDNPFDPDGEAIRQGVDSTGVVFDPPGGLWITDPVIRGEESAIAEAVAVVASLPDDISRRVRDVQAVSPDDIRLRLGNDAIVRWGNATEPEFKAEVLLSLLPRRAAGYDISAPELPTTFREKGPKD